MSHLLLELGAEGKSLTHLKNKRVFKDKALLDLLKVLSELESLVKSLTRYRIDAQLYVQQLDAKKGLPLYLIRMEGKSHFLYDDEELAQFDDDRAAAWWCRLRSARSRGR